VIDIFLENHRILSNSPISTELIDANDYIAYTQLSVKFYTGVEYFSNHTGSPYSFMVNSALASCETMPPIHSEDITFFSLTSNATFILTDDLSIPPGETLNPYFSIQYDGGTQLPLPIFLNSPENHPMEIPLYLFLNTAPLNNQIHQFTVNYKLDSGNDFTATTEKVIITP